MRCVSIGLGLVLLGAASCEKVIDLKVGDSTPQVVVEGRVTDSAQAWTVRLTKTIPFDTSTYEEPVAGASVLIQDATAGTTDTLREAIPGHYVTQFAKAGVAGHTYNLTIQSASGTFTATSVLPQRVPIDSTRVETSSAFGRTAAQLFVVFTDPPGIPNFYRFVLRANGKKQRTDVRDDRLTDGRVNGRPSILPYDDEEGIGSGTVVTIDIEGLDAGVYNYFRSFGNADGSSAAPANPITNIQGGAQGYFGALSVQQQIIVLP
ncbi:MAG: DUF4249 domain-containing protein [Sphingobacteriales bacterium]|nr:MAG: DUF4249 domain-containing protein [Sphingobacteriales bacterium]